MPDSPPRSEPPGGADDVSMASEPPPESAIRHALSTQESVEFIPTRGSKVTPPKPAANPLQFIKVGPCDLYKTAQEQIKKVEEVKKIKAEVRDEAEDWQSNLDNWKCGRRKRQEHIIERVVEVKKLELEEHDRNRRRSKTFNEMMEERNSRGRKTSLMVFNDEEANDLSDLGIGTSSGDDNQSLSDRDDQSHNGNHGDDEMPTNDNASLDTPYDRAIQNYVNFAETQIKTKNNANEDGKVTEVNGHKDTNGKTPPQYKPRRETDRMIEEKIAFLDERRRSSTELNSADKIKLVKVDVSKRKELFEKAEHDDAKSPSQVSNFNKSKSIKERLSHLGKHGEANDGKNVNRASSEISGTIKDRLSSLERQKSVETLDSKEVVLRKRLSNGDISAPQSVKERLSYIENQSIVEGTKSVGNKIPVEVTIKERVSNLDSSVNKDIQKVTPDRDPSFRSKLANFRQDETENVYVSANAEKTVMGSERSSSPEDEIYATKRTQFHRSLDSLDVEDDLANGGFERVQSLEDIECVGRRNYPPSASSTEMLVFSSQSGDTDREDSGIHTADVSSSVSQADEPVEDGEIVGHHLDLDIEILSHRRQPSELSDQTSPLPPIQELFEASTAFNGSFEEGQERSSQSDDVSQTSTVVGSEVKHVLTKSLREVLIRRTPSPLVLVDIDITDLPRPSRPIVSFKPDLTNPANTDPVAHHTQHTLSKDIVSVLVQPPPAGDKSELSNPNKSRNINTETPVCRTQHITRNPTLSLDDQPLSTINKSEFLNQMISRNINTESAVCHDTQLSSPEETVSGPVQPPKDKSEFLIESNQSATLTKIQLSSHPQATTHDMRIPVNISVSETLLKLERNNTSLETTPLFSTKPSDLVTVSSEASLVVKPVEPPIDIVSSEISSVIKVTISDVVAEPESPNTPSKIDFESLPRFTDASISSEISADVTGEAQSQSSEIEKQISKPTTAITLSTNATVSPVIQPIVNNTKMHGIAVKQESHDVASKNPPKSSANILSMSNQCEIISSSNLSKPQIHTSKPDPKPQQPTSNGPKIISVSLKTDPTTEILEPTSINKPTLKDTLPAVQDFYQPVTVSGVLKLELSMDTLLREKSKSSPPSLGYKDTPKDYCDALVVSFNPKPPPKEHKSVKTYVKEKLSSLKIRKSPDIPAKEPVVGDGVGLSKAEKRRTVVELCERVDVSMPDEAKPPMSTPYIDIQAGSRVGRDKDPVEAVIASRSAPPDKLKQAAREVTPPTHVVDQRAMLVDEDAYSVETVCGSGFETETIVESHTRVSTNEILPLNLSSEVEMFSGELALFPLGPPSSAEPPKEKPPPPPTDLSDEEVSKPKASLRRVDSTKRIKKEIRRKRSDFLGIEGTTDDSYLEPVLSIAPDMTAFLLEEQRQQKQLYRQSVCSESDSNPGESRDSGVELERHVDDLWLGKQVLSPDMSAQHSRQESELYGNTSEEDEITKKEREIIEMLEKEEQWRYASNNSARDDLGEKLAEKLRQLEQEKLQLEWDRAEEERRRIVEENARREETMRLRAKEQDLRKQETNHTEETSPAGQCGDGNNVGELIRLERERLQLEQEELVNQRENLILRETQQLHRNMKQQWDTHPSAAVSLQDVSRSSGAYPYNSGVGLPPAVPPAPLNYRLSLPDLQEQVAANQRAPPPTPPAKPTRGQRERDMRTVSPAAETTQLRHGGQADGVQLRRNGNSQTDNPHVRHSTGNTQQQMSRQTLQALSAAPRSRIVSTDNWIQAKKKPESAGGSSYNYQHWLIQEAEHRRITEQQQRTATRKQPPVQPPPPRDKPLPDAIIQTLTQRVQNRAANHDNKNSPVRRDVANHGQSKMQNGHHANNNSPLHGQMSANGHMVTVANAQMNSQMNGNSPMNGQMNGNGPMNISMNGQMNGNASMNGNSTMNGNGHMGVQQMNVHEKMLSVSGKKKCSHCTDELGRGAAMIIESLRLFYHIDCFKCCVCHTQLGDGLMGTDVRVRNNKLHCHNCYSSDDGVKFSCV